MIVRNKWLTVLGLTGLLLSHFYRVEAQQKTASPEVYVDDKGVMRWGSTRKEVQGFGVNYTVPFAHAYRTAQRLNVDLEKAIDDDVYHFARLGFDTYRVHVYDSEVSDTLGNLLDNAHLKTFDYALKKMKERGMKFILTPIAYWGNGWPEPDEKTPGFSSKYGKDASLTNPDAIKAQEMYLFQFLNHVNPYTGVAYKDDPDIIAFEVSNEPHHGEAPAQVTAFINRMVQSMRKTGCRKPIFYNISHKVHLADAYFDADIQGGTFQWYPTGLGAGRELGGNLLPNVDAYTIPFANNPRFRKSAKIVYEFDAADVGRSYIYPAMARSFRTAGIQVATHFAYDPTYMAYANTEFGTHYMNLAYAPQKALSLKIASEVFHTVPMYKDYGSYPRNASFDGFQVSYEKDLAEMVTEKKFIYTNHTTHAPTSAAKLEQVAGWGNSPLVNYAGTGAYFLNKLENGVWRLEVMPDAVWVRDPFEKASLKKVVAVINWRKWPIRIQLPDLGEGYSVVPLNDGNTIPAGPASGATFTVSPGTYLLVKKGTRTQRKGTDRWQNLTIKEFAAPATTLKTTYVRHQPLAELAAGQPLTISATVATGEAPEAVELRVTGRDYRTETFPMQCLHGYQYGAAIPADLIREGILTYTISVREKGQYRTFPGNVAGQPSDWDYYNAETYQTRVVPDGSPVYLFNALTDAAQLDWPWTKGAALLPAAEPGKGEWLVNVEKLWTPDSENQNAEKIYDYSFRYYFGQKMQGRQADLASKKQLVFRGRSLNGQPCPLQVALVIKDGSAYGGILTLSPETQAHTLKLSDLRKIKLVTLPRPYPSFLPYYFENKSSDGLVLSEVESLQFSIGPDIPESAYGQKHSVAIESVVLE